MVLSAMMQLGSHVFSAAQMRTAGWTISPYLLVWFGKAPQNFGILFKKLNVLVHFVIF